MEKNKNIHIRISEREYERIALVAKNDKRTISDWARMILENAAKAYFAKDNS